MADGLGNAAVIVEGHHILPPVVAVHHAYAVGGPQPLPGGEAAAGEHRAEGPLRQGQGQSQGDPPGLPGLQDDLSLLREAGKQVISRRLGAAPAGQDGGAV